MSRWHLLIAAAGALGLGASVALAQQDRQEAAQQQEPATTAATEAPAEPRTDEEVLADSLAAHLARIEARRQASEAGDPPVPPPPGIQYHPGW